MLNTKIKLEKLLEEGWFSIFYDYAGEPDEQETVERYHQEQFGKGFEQAFLENWRYYLLKRTEKETKESAREIAGAAYNTAFYTELAIASRRTREEIPEIRSKSRFIKDLRFEDIDYEILSSGLICPIPERRIKRMRTIGGCTELLLTEKRKTKI